MLWANSIVIDPGEVLTRNLHAFPKIDRKVKEKEIHHRTSSEGTDHADKPSRLRRVPPVVYVSPLSRGQYRDESVIWHGGMPIPADGEFARDVNTDVPETDATGPCTRKPLREKRPTASRHRPA